LQSALDALSTQIVIVDELGKIVAVNASWRRFAQENSWTWPEAGVGASYFDVWKAAFAPEREVVSKIGAGIESVLQGQGNAFPIEYQTRPGGRPALVHAQRDPVSRARHLPFGGRARRCDGERSSSSCSFTMPKRWKRSGSSPAAWRTISTISWW